MGVWLKPAQILSYFSRYTSEVRKKGITAFKPDDQDQEQAREEASMTIAEEPAENNIYQEPYEDQEQVSYLTTEEQIRASVILEEEEEEELWVVVVHVSWTTSLLLVWSQHTLNLPKHTC